MGRRLLSCAHYLFLALAMVLVVQSMVPGSAVVLVVEAHTCYSFMYMTGCTLHDCKSVCATEMKGDALCADNGHNGSMCLCIDLNCH